MSEGARDRLEVLRNQAIRRSGVRCRRSAWDIITPFVKQVDRLWNVCNLTFIASRTYIATPNVGIGRLAFLLVIREDPSSDLCPEAGYHNRGFVWLFCIIPHKYRDTLQIRPRRLPSIFSSAPPHHSTLYILIYCKHYYIIYNWWFRIGSIGGHGP
jgi:hypothetical protein